MRILSLSLLAAGLLAAGMGTAFALPITGTFRYEDREWDKDGYTGTSQDLPIRHADVEVVRDSDQAVLASGRTDANGDYSIEVALGGTTSLYVRCLSSTDDASDYHIKVVDTFVRTGGTVDLSASTVHAVAAAPQAVNPAFPVTGDFGTVLIQDSTGSGTAQAYNILDNAVDAFDYVASASGIGRYPFASEFVVFGWNGTSGAGGSNYFWQGIFITSTGSDTDGWSDTVILHETGHWASDMFGRDHNPGGSHFIGDNFQDPRLSYGEGYATFFCAQVREFAGLDHTSLYADLAIPAPLPTPGNLEFAYDFETGIFNTGTPIGQIGTANETNVTSAMWDLVDGVATPDETPGADDDPGDESGVFSWDVIQNYMPPRGDVDWLTIEDFYEGWFVQHGAGFMKTAVDSAFIGLGGMEFFEDAFEPDDTPATATAGVCSTYATVLGGTVVINECDQGAEDKVELFNADSTAVDLTGWVIRIHRNGYAQTSYTFPAFTLYPGSFVIVHEGGNPADNGSVHLYGGGFSIPWLNGDDGACTIEDDGGTAVDFVRWDNVSGFDPNTTPVPPGLAFTGTLVSSPAGKNLARDKDGADSDDASDFADRDATMGSPNFDSVPHHTIYPEGDVDVVRVDLMAGDLVVIQASSPHSAGEPVLELLDAGGLFQGSAQAAHGISSFAELQFIAPSDTTVYVRVHNGAPYTLTAPLDLIVYKRPSSAVLAAPVAVAADPENLTDVADNVALQWFNGGAYDQVEVLRNGGVVATLAGDATSWSDAVNRGLYTYAVRGVLGSSTSLEASTVTFAGLIPCTTGDDFESGAGKLVTEGTWAITGTLAEAGAFSLHDSPGGDYGNDLDISVELIEPAELLAAPALNFDHICITEATFDFGYVEISTDFGNSWVQLAQYDLDDHASWADASADPGDWVHEVIDLTDYLGQQVRIRFRLVTDTYVVEDGWYIDNVVLSDSTCTQISAVPEDAGPTATLMRAHPNPFVGSLTISFTLDEPAPADVQIFDAQGRLVRSLHRGLLDPAARLVWDGRSDSGRHLASGLYLIRAVTPGEKLVRRVLKLR